MDFLAAHGFAEAIRFDLAIHQVVRSQLTGRFLPSREPEPGPPAAVGARFHLGEAEHHLALAENGEAISERRPYPEEIVVRASSMDAAAQSIHCNRLPDFSAMETITSLNKRLLQTLFPNEAGKWYFARVQLKRLLPREGFDRLEVILKGNLNFELTRSLIKIDGADAGFIFFSLVR